MSIFVLKFYRKIELFSTFPVIFSVRNSNCKVRLHKPIDNDDSRHFFLTGKHFHKPDSRCFKKKKVLSKIKKLAKSTAKPAKDIIVESLNEVKKATLAVLPKQNQLRHTIFRARTNKNIPKNPKKLSELILEEEFCKTKDGRKFLLYDSGTITDEANENEKRLMMFGTEENLKFMTLCTQIYMDGTFSVTPRLFNQLYTIHGE